MVAEFDLMSVCWLVLLKIEPIYDSGVQHTPIKYRGRLSWRPHLFPKAIAGLSSRHFSKLLDAASPRLLVGLAFAKTRRRNAAKRGVDRRNA
jgi:hypothetical protein